MAKSKTARTPRRRKGRARSWGPKRWLVLVALAVLALPFGLILLYRFANPPASTLMVGRYLSGGSVRHTWVPLERISPHLIAAVVSNEDNRICVHSGVDWGAVEEAIEQAEERGGHPRGASTIPMQTAKNLFLWPQRSYLRKAAEIPLAYAITAAWPKRRVVEVYLNIAEWAPGVYGAEAAARHHFKKSARGITRREAALLAAALPNPYVRHAGRAGPKTRRLARLIERRMGSSGPWLACIRSD
jgi:monofunctional biosynthetic peptidoglycan transglycosylase